MIWFQRLYLNIDKRIKFDIITIQKGQKIKSRNFKLSISLKIA